MISLIWVLWGNLTKETYVQQEAEAKTRTSTSSLNSLISEEFGKDSIMHRVARCESTYRHFYSDTTNQVVVSKTQDYGLFQIHAPLWGRVATKLGYDIYSPYGNVKMASYILKTQGLQAWSASKPCWGLT